MKISSTLFLLSLFYCSFLIAGPTLVGRCGDHKPGQNGLSVCGIPEFFSFISCKGNVNPKTDQVNLDKYPLIVEMPLDDFLQCPDSITKNFLENPSENNYSENAKSLIVNLVDAGIKKIGQVNLSEFLPYLDERSDRKIIFKDLIMFNLVKKESANIGKYRSSNDNDTRHTAINIPEKNLIIINQMGWHVVKRIAKNMRYDNNPIDKDLYHNLSKELEKVMSLHEVCGILGCHDKHYETSLSIWFANRILKLEKNPFKAIVLIQNFSNSLKKMLVRPTVFKKILRKPFSNFWAKTTILTSSLFKIDNGGFDGSGGGDFSQLAYKMLLIARNIPFDSKNYPAMKRNFSLKLKTSLYSFKAQSKFFAERKTPIIYHRNLIVDEAFINIPAGWFNYHLIGLSEPKHFVSIFKNILNLNKKRPSFSDISIEPSNSLNDIFNW